MNPVQLAVASCLLRSHADLDPRTPVIPTDLSSEAGGAATGMTHALPTNGILYLDLALDLRGLLPELLPLVPLFCRQA